MLCIDDKRRMPMFLTVVCICGVARDAQSIDRERLPKAHEWNRGRLCINDGPILQTNFIEELKREAQDLRTRVAREASLARLAGVEDPFGTVITYSPRGFANKYQEPYQTTWGKLFSLISPKLLETPNDGFMKLFVPRVLLEASGKVRDFEKASMPDHDFDSTKVHLMALGLVETTYTKTVSGSMALFWVLTDKGRSLMLELRSAKKQ
jgi:hypothetical protein